MEAVAFLVEKKIIRRVCVFSLSRIRFLFCLHLGAPKPGTHQQVRCEQQLLLCRTRGRVADKANARARVTVFLCVGRTADAVAFFLFSSTPNSTHPQL